MDNLNYLNSRNNKEFLWNLLYEKKIFYNIPNDMVNHTKNIFENSITNSLNFIVKNNMDNSNLLNLNKLIVKNLNEDFINFKSNILKKDETKDNLKKEKIDIFNNKFEKQKQNMEDILILKKPQDIDFRDNKLDDKPIDINSVNSILEKMEKERNMILNTNNENTNNENTNNENTNTIISDKNKIFVKNIISDNNIIMNEIKHNNNSMDNSMDNSIDNSIDNKKKISSLEDLLMDKNDFKKRNSKVNFKDINMILDNEYKYENITNLNVKIDYIYKTLNKVIENQEKIMKKLSI